MGDGLSYYSKHVGSWVVPLTREKFVQLSLELFQKKGLKCPPEEAKVFYDVFDSINMGANATLSIGELAGGLVTFFAGTLDERATAVYNLLDKRGTNKLSKATFSEFLKPYVWSMVPESAAILRPILLPYVAEEIFGEMSFSPSKDHVSCNEFVRWVQRGLPNAAQLSAVHAVAVFSTPIVDRCATIIEGVVHVAWQEYEGKQQLRTYGQQTWEAGHDGQSQRLVDVGMYRYAVTNYKQPSVPSMPSVETPSMVTGIVNHVSKEMQEAMASITSPEFWRSGETDELDMRSERFPSSVSQGVLETPHDEEVPLPPPPPPLPPPPQNAPLPNLLSMPARNVPSLASLPETAYGLTRPTGFPHYEIASRQTQILMPASYPVKSQVATTYPYSQVRIIQ